MNYKSLIIISLSFSIWTCKTTPKSEKNVPVSIQNNNSNNNNSNNNSPKNNGSENTSLENNNQDNGLDDQTEKTQQLVNEPNDNNIDLQQQNNSEEIINNFLYSIGCNQEDPELGKKLLLYVNSLVDNSKILKNKLLETKTETSISKKLELILKKEQFKDDLNIKNALEIINNSDKTINEKTFLAGKYTSVDFDGVSDHNLKSNTIYLKYNSKRIDNWQTIIEAFDKEIEEDNGKFLVNLIRYIGFKIKFSKLDLYGLKLKFEKTQDNSIALTLSPNSTYENFPKGQRSWANVIDPNDSFIKNKSRFNEESAGYPNQYKKFEDKALKEGLNRDNIESIAFDSKSVRIIIPTKFFPTFIQFSLFASDKQILSVLKLLTSEMKKIGAANIKFVEANIIAGQTQAQFNFRINYNGHNFDKDEITLGQ